MLLKGNGKRKMENKYLNEAIIGNKNMIATFTSKGELQRLYFPSKDNKQYINFFSYRSEN